VAAGHASAGALRRVHPQEHREGLEQEFNSLDAQREAAGAYVRSQAGQGWALLPQRYDDGGFTGGNVDRPALQRLMADVQAGQIDCVVVYKVECAR
jgi:site-specific DNA recombinase